MSNKRLLLSFSRDLDIDGLSLKDLKIKVYQLIEEYGEEASIDIDGDEFCPRVILRFKREENDVEYQSRKDHERNQKELIQNNRAKIKEIEQLTLKRLLDKYGLPDGYDRKDQEQTPSN